MLSQTPYQVIGDDAYKWGYSWAKSALKCMLIASTHSIVSQIPATNKFEKIPRQTLREKVPERRRRSNRLSREIINEPNVAKDWGGERSDMFSSRVAIDGTRISAAFAFKGPAQFQPMTMAQLGKNGDQIGSAFHRTRRTFMSFSIVTRSLNRSEARCARMHSKLGGHGCTV